MTVTVEDLKQQCRDKNIKGYSRLNKVDLIKLCAGKRVIFVGSEQKITQNKKEYNRKPIKVNMDTRAFKARTVTNIHNNLL